MGFLFFPFFSLSKNFCGEAKRNKLKVRFMKQAFTVKTNSLTADLSKPHFFVLSKGLNSGKPLENSCANCFVITCKSDKLREQLFWLCYGMWQSKAFHIYLRGSVIPFISIVEFRKAINEAFNKVEADKPKFDKSVNSLQLLEQKQKRFYENIQLIEEAKRIVMYRYIKRR